MRAVIPALSALALLAVAAASATADVLKVPKQFPTIQAAIDAAGAGDVVEISKGVYHERPSIDTKTDLTLRAKKGEKVVVDGDGVGSHVLWITDSQDITVQRLRLRNVGSSGIYATYAERLRVEDCRIADVGWGITAVAASESELRGCSIAGTVHDGILLVDDSAGCVVAENALTDIGRDAIVATGTMHLVERNTIDGAEERGLVLGDGVTACTRTVLRDNVVEQVKHGVVFGDTSDCAAIGNTLRQIGSFGLYLEGDRALIEGNRIIGAGAAGMWLWEGSDCRFLDNLVKKAYTNGYVFEGGMTGASLVGNRALKSGFNGFYLRGSGHCLQENVAKGSGAHDLYDESTGTLFVANEFGSTIP